MNKTILAIETATNICSVALFKDQKLISIKEDMSRKHATLLAPFVNDIFNESVLSKFKNLEAVITIPDLLAPGISAKTWNKPINKIFLVFKLFLNDFDTSNLSEKYNKSPKIKVDQAITFISRIFS